MPNLPDDLKTAFGTDYTIERELGGGGMSRVFVATERALQRKVVIKLLPPELSGGVNIERFRREIQLAAQLQHPHIVPLLTASSDRDILWFTMPFIEGSSLRKTLEKSQRLPPRDVVRILHDVVDALAYAHARGVVHRDIKPDNILTSGMHAMVTDFGVAKALSAAIPAMAGTTTGMAIGTPAYMAPEQLAADPAADHRVDIYAVGLLAYELLTGKSPFSGASPQATLAAQLTVTPEAPHRTLPEIPEALSQIVMRCLEKDSSKRFQTAGELLVALDALPPMGSGSVLAPARPARRRWPAIAAVAAVLVAALAYAATVLDSRNDEQRLAFADSLASRQPSDTVPSVRDTGAMPDIDNDRSRTMALPVVISRAESLAIAEAIQKRMRPDAARPVATAPVTPPAATSPATAASGSSAGGGASAGTAETRFFIATSKEGQQVQVDREQLRMEVQRIFADSAFRAMTRVDSMLANLPRVVRMDGGVNPRMASTAITPLVAPPDEGTVRVVVTPFSPRGNVGRDLPRFGAELADAVRGALARVERVDIPSAEITERAFQSGDHAIAGWRLRADFVVSGVYVQRRDSLTVVVQFTDVRTGRFARAEQIAVPTEDTRRAFEPTTGRVLAWLDTARALPGRHGPPRPPGFQSVPGRGGSRPPPEAQPPS